MPKVKSGPSLLWWSLYPEYKALSYLYLTGSSLFLSVITCAEENIPNSSKLPDLTTYAYNATVDFTCVTGHEHTSGDLERTCTGIDTWSGSAPVCSSMYLYFNEWFAKNVPSMSSFLLNDGKQFHFTFIWSCSMLHKFSWKWFNFKLARCKSLCLCFLINMNL